MRACWSIPILSRVEANDAGESRLLGTFAMYYTAPRQPGATDWRAIDRSVGLAATAIERSRAAAALREEERRSRELYAEAQRQARELALLDQVRTALASELDPRAVYRTIVEAIAAALVYPRVILCLIQGDEIVLEHASGYDHLRDRMIFRMPLSQGVIGRVARTGAPALVTNVAADPDYRDVGDGTTSEICVPLRDAGRIIGALNVEGTGTNYLGETDLRLITALGEHASLAIGRARLYAEAQRQAQELALLDRVRTALARELAPTAVFRTIVEAIGSIFGHTRVSLYLLEGGYLVRQSLTGPAIDRFTRLPIARGIMGRVARTGQPILLEDVDTDPEFIRVAPDIISEVCVPLFDEGRVVGVLNLESTDGMRLGEPDLRLMIALSEQIGIAIGRARHYAAARSSADNLAAAQRIAHLGSWEENLLTGTIIWSDEAFRIHGREPQSFTPTVELLAEAIHPDDREVVLRARRTAHEGAEPRPIDFRLVRPDGDVRIVHQQSEVIRDYQGRPVIRRGVILDVTERRALEARLAHQATHDPLTGLPNRMLLLDRLGQALAHARRGGAPCAVLVLDLDNFKVVNDTLGHDAGDRLLVATADRLRHCLREGDTLARLGGDEFAALLGEVANAGEAIEVGQRLAKALEPPFPLDGQVYRIGASIGIVLSTPEHSRPDDLLRDADIAMYRAKSASDVRLALFDPAMQERIVERVALERDLRGALERGELSLHYQPIVDLVTGRIVEAEALVRWRHPQRGLVPPDIFVPVAEESGLIAPLGRWVLGEACRQARAWRDRGNQLVVAVNLSAREFGQADLARVVAAALHEADLAPDQLRIEITERLAMRDAAVTSATLAALRELGVQVAIDDFGTGYSSLAYLKRFPVDALKIDRSFIAGLGNSAEDAAIVGATTGLGRTLGLAVTAEGVETAAQVAHLRALGCDLAQGYFFARPLEPCAFGALLDTGLIADLPAATRLPHAPTTGQLRQRRTARSAHRTLPTIIGAAGSESAF
ncbi:MAG: EAL domain-containing protein [Thermomicrobiales bacterium]